MAVTGRGRNMSMGWATDTVRFVNGTSVLVKGGRADNLDPLLDWWEFSSAAPAASTTPRKMEYYRRLREG